MSTSKSQKPVFDPKKTVFLIDGSSFLYRAYYGVRPMHTSAGIPVQAVYNFCRMIRKLLDTFKPRYMALVWDSPGKTERHEIFEDYKATRQDAPSDLFAQKAKIVEFADLIGIAQIAQPGIEADDLLYSVARDRAKSGDTVVLITSDKDMGQILSEQIILFDWFKDEFIDASALEARLGFPVQKIPFYYALIGDSSDNIPGVAGVGKVTATELVSQFDSLEDLYKNLDKVKREKLRATLATHKDDAFLSLKLFLLRYHKLDFKKDGLRIEEANWPKARPLFEELEFKSLLKDLGDGVVQKLTELKGYKFITVTTPKQLSELVAAIKKAGHFAFDTEADALGALTCTMVGFSVCYEPGTSYYIPVAHQVIAQLSREQALEPFRALFADSKIKKYAHHAKYDMLVLSQYGVEINGLVFDTLIAAHLITEDWQRISLKYLSKYYLQETMLSFDDVVTANKFDNFGQVPLELATEYAAADAHQTFRLVSILRQALKTQQMERLYYDIELPLMQVLFRMERAGILLEPTVLEKLNKLVSKDVHALELKILAAVGTENQSINLASPKQLEKLLFTDLLLPVQRKTKTGSYSTDQEVLEVLAKLHPVPGLIIRWRELTKLQGTYLEALPGYTNPLDKKIHTTFSQTSVATGRLSSSDPNLQNVPTHTKPYDLHVRTAFVPEPGHVFISADYSQIELRVLAFLSGDAELTNAFVKNKDIHTQTAAKLFDVSFDAVTQEQRQLGKRINFSIMYGMTPYGLSQDLDISFADAKKYIERFFDQYPGVSAWMEKTVEQTKEKGYVTTHWGRRRYIPGIYETNKTLFELAKRIAINTPAQGTAAELMKIGMIKLEQELAREFPQAKILLQIHDELLIAVPEKQAVVAQQVIKHTLETIVAWPVPLVVDTRVGNNWQEVTK